jgi:hypothetical protein
VNAEDPTPRTKGKRLRLRSLMDVRSEMARVYRDMRSMKLDTETGYRLVQSLASLGKLTEVTQGRGLLERLEKLEGVSVSEPDRNANPPAH